MKGGDEEMNEEKEKEKRKKIISTTTASFISKISNECQRTFFVCFFFTCAHAYFFFSFSPNPFLSFLFCSLSSRILVKWVDGERCQLPCAIIILTIHAHSQSFVLVQSYSLFSNSPLRSLFLLSFFPFPFLFSILRLT